jgi:hypothetical protein
MPMQRKPWATWIAGGGALLLLLYLVWTYNHLITLRNRVRNGWSQIDVQLRRRHELIPNQKGQSDMQTADCHRESIQIKASRKVGFRPAKELKDAI